MHKGANFPQFSAAFHLSISPSCFSTASRSGESGCKRKYVSKSACALGINGGLEIVGYLHIFGALVGAVPTPIGLSRLNRLEPVPGHPAFLDEPCDVVDIDLAPDALLAAARVALQIALVVKAFAHRVDPAPAKHDVDGFKRGNR